MIGRRGSAGIVVTVGILTITGCVSTGVPPAAFTHRAMLASCGEIVLDQGESIPGAARDCMAAAADEDGAELTVTAPTTEGDPIVTYYRVGPTIEGAELFIDGTADTFGPRTWTQQACPTATIPEFGGCAN